MIWQRGSAREIMREARLRYRESWEKDPAGAHVALASTHYSLVKRYVESWWQWPLGLWHLRGAVFHANQATNSGVLSTFEQVDVCSTILSKSLSRRDREKAEVLVVKALVSLPLHAVSVGVKSHTHALLWCTLGEVRLKNGDMVSASTAFSRALGLVKSIEEEISEDREEQLSRVLAKIGFFVYDHVDRGTGVYYLKRAYGAAWNRGATDQVEKVKAGCRKRGIQLGDRL